MDIEQLTKHANNLKSITFVQEGHIRALDNLLMSLVFAIGKINPNALSELSEIFIQYNQITANSLPEEVKESYDAKVIKITEEIKLMQDYV